MARSDVLVSADWAEQNLNTPKTVFVEVDEDTSAYDGGHIEGAVKLDWRKDLQDGVRRDFLNQEQFSDLLSAKGIANDDTVVLYGGNNNWFAAYAYWYFKLYGHQDIKLIDGGRKKWELDGRPLLHHALEAAATVAAQIVVVAAPGIEPSIPVDLASRVRVVHDPEPFGGPLVGLMAALSVVERSIVLVVGGDMPQLVPAVLSRLVATVGPDRRAVLLEVPGRLQPLPMALDVAAALAARMAILDRGGRSLRELLRELGAVSIPAPVWLSLDPAGVTIVDIDRPGDLGS